MASEDEVGFPPGFSRNVEAILKIGSAGGFFSMEEFRENLRLAGLSLGADEYPAPPEFELPDPDESGGPEYKPVQSFEGEEFLVDGPVNDEEGD